MKRFADRADAGRHLAAALRMYRGPGTIVLGLPRGGVPVAAEVAAALGAPLDVPVVRKLGVPAQPELAFGAIGEGSVVDDGFATGATARAAAVVARAQGAATVLLAAPIGAADTVEGLHDVADEVVCLGAPLGFRAVGQGYHDLNQTSDGQVRALLAAAHRDRPGRQTGQ